MVVSVELKFQLFRHSYKFHLEKKSASFIHRNEKCEPELNFRVFISGLVLPHVLVCTWAFRIRGWSCRGLELQSWKIFHCWLAMTWFQGCLHLIGHCTCRFPTSLCYEPLRRWQRESSALFAIGHVKTCRSCNGKIWREIVRPRAIIYFAHGADVLSTGRLPKFYTLHHSFDRTVLSSQQYRVHEYGEDK